MSQVDLDAVINAYKVLPYSNSPPLLPKNPTKNRKRKKEKEMHS